MDAQTNKLLYYTINKGRGKLKFCLLFKLDNLGQSPLRTEPFSVDIHDFICDRFAHGREKIELYPSLFPLAAGQLGVAGLIKFLFLKIMQHLFGALNYALRDSCKSGNLYSVTLVARPFLDFSQKN